MQLFHYPKSRHHRRLQPPQRANYRFFKPFVQEEFSHTCIYCRMPDRFRGDDNYGVEHYRPKGKFPKLASTYSNLFYACNTCNRRKGDFWPSKDAIAKGRFVPNPCDHVMFSHVRTSRNCEVETRTLAGEMLVDLLMLNDEQAVKFRHTINSAASLASAQRDKATRVLVVIKEKEESATGVARRRWTHKRIRQEMLVDEAVKLLESLVG